MANEQHRDACWLVESCPMGKFEGWWAGPPKGEGGWLTMDPLKAKRYSQAEALAVAEAMSYFPTPFRWSCWVATEHVFLDKRDPQPAPAEGQRYFVTPPVPGGYGYWDVRDRERENFALITIWREMPGAEQTARSLCDRLNGHGEGAGR